MMETNTGVYKIYFKGSDDFGYIGSSSNLKERKKDHLRVLRKDKHHNSHLQDAYEKYGESNFEFFVIEYLPDSVTYDEMFNIEQYWLNTIGIDTLYNIRPSVVYNSVLPEETRQKLRGKKGPNRNIEVWNNYQFVYDLRIDSGFGRRRICEAYNQEFGTNYKPSAFQRILKNIDVKINS